MLPRRACLYDVHMGWAILLQGLRDCEAEGHAAQAIDGYCDLQFWPKPGGEFLTLALTRGDGTVHRTTVPTRVFSTAVVSAALVYLEVLDPELPPDPEELRRWRDEGPVFGPEVMRAPRR